VDLSIAPPADAADLAAAKRLILDYAEALGVDLGFQDFAGEMANFPGAYVPPAGALLLARHEGRPAGVVALRDLGGRVAEMKRLYVKPDLRGLALGRRLVEAVLAEARRLGYRTVRLDTIPALQPRATVLYRALGFREIAPYRPNPFADALYFELDL